MVRRRSRPFTYAGTRGRPNRTHCPSSSFRFGARRVGVKASSDAAKLANDAGADGSRLNLANLPKRRLTRAVFPLTPGTTWGFETAAL